MLKIEKNSLGFLGWKLENYLGEKNILWGNWIE
jgi:hypothetical protein